MADKVRVDGDVKYFSKIEAGLEQIANNAASGDLRAIKIVLPLTEEIDQPESSRSCYADRPNSNGG